MGYCIALAGYAAELWLANLNCLCAETISYGLNGGREVPAEPYNMAGTRTEKASNNKTLQKCGGVLIRRTWHE